MRAQVNSGPDGPAFKRPTQPTPDQLYLAEKIEERFDTTEITVAGIQRLNTRYGVGLVTTALRTLHGFPPPTRVLKPYAYVQSMCDEMEKERGA